MTDHRTLKDDVLINRAMGEKIRQLRLSNSWSRTQVVRHIGVSNQQLLKYERGQNKVSMGRLKLIAKLFEKPISYFYEEPKIDNYAPELTCKLATGVYNNFIKLKNEKLKKSISNLIRTLVDNESKG